jgi:hypothetical protein
MSTDYQKLVSAKAKYCRGEASKAEVKKNYTTYVTSAIASGKPKKEAERIGKRILSGGCKMTAVIGKKRTTTRKTKTIRRKTV